MMGCACCLLLAVGCSEQPVDNPVDSEPTPIEESEARRHLRLWLQLSSDALERGEFDLAQAHARKALETDPHSARATELLALAAKKRSAANDRKLREKLNAEWREAIERLQGPCDLVGPEPLNYPENWDEVVR